MLAAVLACGEGAVVSHLSAAALLVFVDVAPVVVDVIAPGRRGLRIDGIRPHRVAWTLGRDEVGFVDGIPCTSPARTLGDMAGTTGDRTLRSAFERAAARRLLDLDAIEAAGGKHRRGAPALRALCREWRPAMPAVRRSRLKSPLEAMVLPLVCSGVPAPRANAPVRVAAKWIEVDFLWDEERFVVEADSRDFHGTEAAFERDRWRDRELMRAGYSTLRVTRRQAQTEAEAVAATIVTQLRRQPGDRHAISAEAN